MITENTTVNPKTRLYVEAELKAGLSLKLSDSQAHQLRAVRRMSDGDAIGVFNGRQGEWLARVAIGRREVTAMVEHQRRPQAPAADLWLAFAPLKHARLDFLIEKASELGVARLLPVITQYTQVSRVSREKLAMTGREAAEQCERLDIPEIAEAQSLHSFLASCPDDRPLYFCAESGIAGEPAVSFQTGRGATILIGPEGGFSPGEHAAIRSHVAAIAVSLGQRLLRAETAAVAALSCWQAIAGEWRAGAARPHQDVIEG